MTPALAAAMIADTGRELRRVTEHLDRPTVLEAMQMAYRPENPNILCRCGCVYRQAQGVATYCDTHAPEPMGPLPDCCERDLGVGFVRD